MKIKTAVAASILVLSASTALADDGFYMLGSVGQSKFKDFTASNVDPAGEAGSMSTKNTDTAFKLQAGYQFNKYFAVEGGYFNLGKAKATVAATGEQLNYKTDGVNVSAVGILPFDNGISLLGKLGVFTSQTKYSSPGESTNLNKTGVVYGLGASYDITKSIAVRAEYEVYNKVGKTYLESDGTTSGLQTKVDMLSVGLAYKF